MTFKSTITILLDHEGGAVTRFKPYFDVDEEEVRHLFLTRRLEDELRRLAAVSSAEHAGRVRAGLGEYVKGEGIEDDETVFKKLSPWDDDIWEYRITLDPQARLFGAFVAPDYFLGVTGRLRKDCEDGGFEEAMEIVRKKWTELFGQRRRWRGRQLSDCISGVT